MRSTASPFSVRPASVATMWMWSLPAELRPWRTATQRTAPSRVSSRPTVSAIASATSRHCESVSAGSVAGIATEQCHTVSAAPSSPAALRSAFRSATSGPRSGSTVRAAGHRLAGQSRPVRHHMLVGVLVVPARAEQVGHQTPDLRPTLYLADHAGTARPAAAMTAWASKQARINAST